MITKAEKVYFESVSDLVDYCSKGISPTPHDFELLMEEIDYQSADPLCLDHEPRIKINKKALADIDSDTLQEVLTRVYLNNRSKNIATFCIGGLAVIAAFGIGCRIGKGSGDKDDD